MKITKVSDIDAMQIRPMPISKYDRVTVYYNGYLTLETDTKIYMHYGFGDNNNWENVKQVEMSPSPKGYTATIKVEDDERLNFCFNDKKNKWDNNYGNNWCFTIQ